MKSKTCVTFLNIICVVTVNGLQAKSVFSCAGGLQSILSFSESNTSLELSWKVEDYVYIYLYTKQISFGEPVKLNKKSLRLSEFDPSRPTKIITHGYFNHMESAACTMPRDVYLSNGDYNVFVVDWWGMMSYKRSVPYPYSEACKYVPLVGRYIARLINFLENHGLNLNDTTLIGHSLGAHVMGIAGYEAINKVGYIVALDPAAPDFESKHHTERISIEDASTVHVIHTNEGDCGMSQPVGHFDFYPNGGNKQPGCVMNACAHARAYEIFAESIDNENQFYGLLCHDLSSARTGNCYGHIIKMNDNLRQQNAKEGIYYFETNESSPYALRWQLFNKNFWISE